MSKKGTGSVKMAKTYQTGRKQHKIYAKHKVKYTALVPASLSNTMDKLELHCHSSAQMAAMLNAVLMRTQKEQGANIGPIIDCDVRDYFNRPTRHKQIERKFYNIELQRR